MTTKYFVAKVCDAQITQKGINPFGKVLNSVIILEGPLISATLSEPKDWGSHKWKPSVESIVSAKTLLYNLNRGSVSGTVGVDLPLVVGTSVDPSGATLPTLKRSS